MDVEKWMRKVGSAVYRAFPIPPGKGVLRSLEHLHPGEKKEVLLSDYYSEKIGKSLCLCALLLILGGCTFLTEHFGGQVEGGALERGAQGGRKVVLEVASETSGDGREMELLLSEKLLTDAELQEAYESFLPALLETLSGENPSLSEVRSDLHPVQSLEGYPFQVAWRSSDWELLSSVTGEVREVPEPTEGLLTAEITAPSASSEEGFLRREAVTIRVLPRDRSGREGFWEGLSDSLKERQKADRGEEKFFLPAEYEGENLTWRIAGDHFGLPLMLAGPLLGVLVFFLSDYDLLRKREERREKMRAAYPDVVRKLSLYMSAGMTAKAAFFKMGKDLGEDNPIYGEILYTCRELRAGRSEREAYERLGRRTALQEYIRMTTLLTQNLRKGSGSLLERLREEAEAACEEKTRNFRRLGEEAVTKLLLPMVMMLLVVMVMILLPAFGSMNL
ncbi:MAG: hypothetical protein K5891_10745 [Lachnospiraceae bacterium]|nr:hypothetical protein [Lachnospiraceae bacterium]